MTVADTEYELVLYSKSGGGSITIVPGDESIMMGRTWTHDENNISSLTIALDNASLIATENLLSSDCARWDTGTCALAMGDYMRYSIYPTTTGTKTQVFYGKITELRPQTDGTLQITAVDYLQKLNREYNKTVFTYYNDLVIKPHSDANGLRCITGITEADILIPCVFVGFAVTDVKQYIGNMDTSELDPVGGATGDQWAQVFNAPGDGLIGIWCHINHELGATGTMTMSIQSDDGAGHPCGIPLASATHAVSGYESEYWHANFVSSSAPFQLKKGTTYWCVFSWSGTDLCTPSVYEGLAGALSLTWLYKPSAGSWTVEDGVDHPNIGLVCYFADYAEVSPDDYVYDEANSRFVLRDNSVPITELDPYASINRGKVSYYYNTVTHQTICDALTGLVGGLHSDTSGSQEIRFNAFNTVGKKLIDCLKELADVWEIDGAWQTYQHTFMHYETGGDQYVGWGKRLNLNDSSSFTFSYGTDGAVDNEHRIIDFTGLVNQTNIRPAGIQVIGGKDVNGNPIVATVSDKAFSSSFAMQMEHFTNVEKISDQNIVTEADAFRRAYAALDSYQRNTWEGTIRVSGVYPDLFDLNPASASFGSGKIITLNIGPVGIIAQKFKVRGVVVHENETEITLSNIWSSIENRVSKTFLKTDKSEAFLAEVGTASNIYFECHDANVCTTSPAYMTFDDESYNPLCNHRVPCVLYKSTDYSGNADLNLYVYHAEFEGDNGFTPDGSPIGSISLWDAPTGGTRVIMLILHNVSPQDERFYKWKTQRLIVDFSTRAS